MEGTPQVIPNGRSLNGTAPPQSPQKTSELSHTREGWAAMLSEEGREAGLSERQALFLDAYVQAAGNVSEAAIAININRRTVYEWITSSKGFREGKAIAWDVMSDVLEAEGMKRATAGLSDAQSGTILVAMLKAHGDKAKWRPEIKHTHGGEIRQTHRITFGGPRADEDLPAF